MTDHPSPGSSNANAAMELGRIPIGTPRHIRAAVSCAAAALFLGLAACGGNNDDAPAAATDQSIVNATNADRVAVEAIQSFELTIEKVFPLPSDDFVLDSVPASAAVRTRLLRAAPTGGARHPLAESINKNLCETSGSLTRTVSQAVARKLTVGDFAELQFDACVQSGTESVGKARETITAVNATQSIFEAHGEWSGFGTTEGDVSVLENGPYELKIENTSATLRKISFTGTQAVTVERRIKQKPNATYSRTALKFTNEVDPAAGAINFNFSYTADGSFPVLGKQRFQINTPQNLSIKLGTGVLTGAVKVGGTDGSTLLLTFLGDDIDSVRLDLDANGDGTIDQSQTRTLAQLQQLALAP